MGTGRVVHPPVLCVFAVDQAQGGAPLGLVSARKFESDPNFPYVLTALGKQFVHYAMTEIVLRIGDGVPSGEGIGV